MHASSDDGRVTRRRGNRQVDSAWVDGPAKKDVCGQMEGHEDADEILRRAGFSYIECGSAVSDADGSSRSCGLPQVSGNGRSPEGGPESRLWAAGAGRTHGCVNGPADEEDRLSVRFERFTAAY
jgi:hypothetical protein